MKILVVDDEPDIVAVLRIGLKKRGYQVLTASDGAAALALAKSENPELMTLDIMMPEMDGYEVCRALKFDPQYAHIKIIFLTAKDHPEDKEKGMTVKADAYITKPFEPEELFKRIESLLAG